MMMMMLTKATMMTIIIMMLMMMMLMMMMMMMMMMQVGPGDDYMLTVEGFNKALSTLGDSMTSGSWNLNGMKFSTK